MSLIRQNHIAYFIKFQSLRASLFNIPCDKMGSWHKELCCEPRTTVVFRKSSRVIKLWTELAAFLLELYFYLKDNW